MDAVNQGEKKSSNLERFILRALGFLRTMSIWVIVVAILLVGARIALPFVLRSLINERLSRVSGYISHVDNVHVALWRGAYALRGVRILKIRGSETDPLFLARNIDFSLAWRELLHRKFVSDIIIEGGRINFVKAATPETSQLEVDRSWQDVIKDIFPIDIMHLEVDNGRIHYLDRTADPAIDIFVDNLQFTATGLRNRPAKSGQEFPAHFKLVGDSIGQGKLSIWADADPLASKAHFEAHGQIENVSLPALNPFLKAYGGVLVDAGNFKLYGEMAARDGRIEGYIKPFFMHVKFTDITQPGRSLPGRVWQAFASGLLLILKNKPQDELAMRIPFSVQTGDTRVGTWKTVASMLHNGFIHALPAALDHSVKSSAIETGTPAPPAPAQKGK